LTGPASAPTSGRIARVLPNVTGLDKHFDYLVPVELAEEIEIGTIVRVDLHGRRVGGWVTELKDVTEASVDPGSLKPIAKRTGCGPSSELIELARWATDRWAARRMRPFLVVASPPRAVPSIPPRRRTAIAPGPSSPATRDLLDAGGGVLRLPPRSDPLPALLAAVGYGPTLVIVPGQDAVGLLASRLRRANVSVAAIPSEWPSAAGGVDVVIGTRSAAWAPCRDMACAVVIDEHDEALQEERSPTWHARDVVVERCRRAGLPCVLISPVPTLVAVEECAPDGVVHPPRRRERAGWPTVTIVDRRDEEPWKRSLLTSTLIERLRDPERRMICVTNITGRARVLACRSCRSLVTCERCDAAVGLDDEGRLVCRRCGAERPAVCQSCGAGAFANLRPGVTRLREELEAAANRPVVALTARTDGDPATADAAIVVGTEAALHRVPTADVVAFLEFDSEMLAPRFRAAEQSLALIVRAARLAPEVLVQTFEPDHVVLRAAALGDPDLVVAGERERRRLLRLPPYGALAVVSGVGAAEVVAQLKREEVSIGGDGDRYLLRADDWLDLGRALNGCTRPPGSRVRIEVDPARV
jgi:primosomal protein N' (replication factor Y) (superfamily II helicase)